MEEGQTYSFWKTVKKGAKYLVFYGVPFAIASFIEFYPEASGLSVGTALTMASNWIKHHEMWQ